MCSFRAATRTGASRPGGQVFATTLPARDALGTPGASPEPQPLAPGGGCGWLHMNDPIVCVFIGVRTLPANRCPLALGRVISEQSDVPGAPAGEPIRVGSVLPGSDSGGVPFSDRGAE